MPSCILAMINWDFKVMYLLAYTSMSASLRKPAESACKLYVAENTSESLKSSQSITDMLLWSSVS